MHELPQLGERTEFRKPIGLRMLGQQYPGELSYQDFENSPDRVYHAARNAFEFDPFLNYEEPLVLQTRDIGEGGLTLGAGFYTTPDKREAENYLHRRGGKRAGAPIYTLLPYRAKMLDLRAADDPESNGDVPPELVEAWTRVMKQAYERLSEKLRQKSELSFGDEMDIEWWEEYLARLTAICESGKTYDLRTVLGTGDAKKEARQELPSYTSSTAPPWINLWTKFMRMKGIDGVIYHEGSEVERGKNSVNVVFYNLEKVGTYASWHRERGHGAF